MILDRPGVLLLTAWIRTDSLGFLLFVPAVREFRLAPGQGVVSFVQTMSTGFGSGARRIRHGSKRATGVRPDGVVGASDEGEFERPQ